MESSRVEAAVQGQGDNAACVPSARQGPAPHPDMGGWRGRMGRQINAMLSSSCHPLSSATLALGRSKTYKAERDLSRTWTSSLSECSFEGDHCCVHVGAKSFRDFELSYLIISMARKLAAVSSVRERVSMAAR